ncbi:kinase D-interacting substrate of 220 kDa-like isoform X1 [Styela clava]
MTQDRGKVVELQFLEPLLLHDIVSNGTTTEVENALKNIPVDQRNQFQQTALHVACELGRPEVATIFISSEANTEAKDQEGTTPLIAASRSGSLACVQLLLKDNADVHVTDNVGWTSLMWASYKGYTEIVSVLLNEGANVHVLVAYNMTPLMWAAGRGHARIVKLLLEKGAKVNSTDKFGSTPLFWACRRGFSEVVTILLEYRVDVDAVGANGANALIAAIQNGHESCVKLILNQSSVNVNHTDKNTNSALNYAAKLGKYEVILMLLNTGAYLNLADKNGDTPLIKAVKHGHLDAVRALLSRFADVDIKGKNNMTALHYSCELGHVAITREILACNADTEAVTDDGDTALLRAVKNKNVPITRMLLDKGARVSATDKKNDTPLHIAIRARSLRLVKLLLRNPQDGRLLYQPNKSGETPYNLDAAHNKSILASVFGAKNMSPESTMQHISGQGIPQSYDLYSSALADILCEPTLIPPITVGLYAKWGSGKSFLLKRLERQMTAFTSANKLKLFEKPSIISFIVVLFISLFFGFLAATLTADDSTRVVSGVITGFSIFLIYCSLICIVVIGVVVGKWKWAKSFWLVLHKQYSYITLLFKLWFMDPPSTKQTDDGKAIPVRFLFTNYSRLTSVGGETSLAEMIGLLSCLAEKNLGFLAVRLYRAFRDEMQERHPVPKYKKFCCIPTFVLGAFLLISVGTIILMITSAYGPEPTLIKSANSTQNYLSAVDGTMLAIGALDIFILFLAAPTIVAMCGALIWSQRKRVLSAAHHTKSQERLMQQLKHEVDLLCRTVIAIDAFTDTQTRMCVTINGLDSCEQDKVLQVLDTVHVLFSQRPYVTILAIDPVIISKAIHGNLNSVFRDANISGYDYLKNIVHLPFYLKDRTKNTQYKRNATDREDKTSDDETEPETNGVVLDNTKKISTTTRTNSFPGRRVNGVRRSAKSLDLGKLMFSEDWFNSVSPQLMKRILNIVSLTGRLLRADGVDFSWGKLAAWINLTEQWPYRTSFLIHTLEKSETLLPGAELLRNVFDKKQQDLNPSDSMLTIDSSDGRSFRAFLSARLLTVRDVRDFLPSTINLDPKLLESIEQDPYKQLATPNSFNYSANYRRYPSVSSDMQKAETQSLPLGTVASRQPSIASPTYQPLPSVQLGELSTEDVANKLYEIKGLAPENVEKYINFVNLNNINGSVLAACELDDLKKELFAPFGDWCLIKQWILIMRSTGVNENCTPVQQNFTLYEEDKGSSLSLEFQSLGGSDRIAYDDAFKEYLRLQPGYESKEFTDEPLSDKASDSPKSTAVNGGSPCEELNGAKVVSPLHSVVPMSEAQVTQTRSPPEHLDLKESSHTVNCENETSPLLILHSNNNAL